MSGSPRRIPLYEDLKLMREEEKRKWGRELLYIYTIVVMSSARMPLWRCQSGPRSDELHVTVRTVTSYINLEIDTIRHFTTLVLVGASSSFH
jgi:hypothetical protein